MARKTIVSMSHAYFQRGAVLILMAFILGLGAAAYVFKALDVAGLQAKQDAKTYQTLKEAKAALIAWAVSHPNVPGMMPWPDRNTDTDFDGDSAYDGKSDCVTTAFQYPYLLGQLPWRAQSNPCATPHTGLGQDFRDAQGNYLWYAVSRNMVHDYEHSEDPIINPGMINAPHAVTPYQRQGGTQSYPWLRVLDRNGSLISDRVAAVIIAPGSSIGDQNRSSLAPDAREFLDGFKIGAVTYKNYDSALSDEDFIMGEDSRHIGDSDNTFQKPYYFNDKLVYITIDELMYAVEQRVLAETKHALNDYYNSKNYYPFAAGFGSATNENQCVQGNFRGLLPVASPSSHTCTCTASSRSCSCNFSVVSSIAFTRNSSRFVATGAAVNAPTGACSVKTSDTKTCTCSGAGSCKRSSGAVQFSCDACGYCFATVAGTNRFNTTGVFSDSTGGCSNAVNQATCSNSANGTFTLATCNSNQVITSLPAAGGQLPAWYLQNQWQKYITYAVSTDCVSGSSCSSVTSPPKITVGVNQNVKSLVAASLANSSGACSIANFLSGAENVNVSVSNGRQDSLYSITQPKTNTNTDQVVVVSP